MSGTLAAAAVGFALLAPLPAQADGMQVTGDVPGAVAKPAAPAAPVAVTSTKVPAAKPDPTSRKAVAELPQTATKKFRMIGVTWSAEGVTGTVKAEVRTRTAGTWSSWTSLDVESDEGEDNAQPGTEPLWVGKADGVAARVTSGGGTPKDVRIVTIDPGASDDAATSTASYSGPVDGVARATAAAATDDGSPTYTPKPSIITRSSWGAASNTPCDSPEAGDHTAGVVIHHSAGSNSYSKSDSAKIVRGIQAYHMKARGWCDIGYNFLVDKYGQIFEGRRGGVDRAVRAAHSGNLAVNTYTMGVSMMGNYDEIKPQAALKDAVVKLVGWRLGTNYLKAKGTYKLGGLTLNMIAGHRNVISTGCPGTYGYAWLSEKGGLRDRVEDYIADYSTPVKKLYASLGSSRTGKIFIGESRSSSGSRLQAKLMDLYSAGSSSSAYYTSGAIRTEHDRLGSRTGDLGYPKSNPSSITGATRQLFQKGRVYAVSGRSKAYSVLGDIATTYSKLGETSGRLGVPTSSTTTVKSGVTRVTFAKGLIESTKSTGRTVAYANDGKVISTSTQTPSGGTPATVTGLTVKAGSHSARLGWSAVSGATTYDICVVTDKAATSCHRYTSGLDARTLLVGSLAPTSGTDFYFKVRAAAGSAKGAWSTFKGFNLVTASAAGDSVTVPSSGTIAITGHGYGHGIGMSQYGAYGAAKQGLKHDAILSHYYPGTKLGTKTGNIRVLISGDTTDAVDVVATSGLKFRKVSSSFTASLPTSIGGSTVRTWRIVQVSSNPSQSTLQYRTSGSYRSYQGIRWTGDGQFYGPSRISLVMPSGSTVKYRGTIRSAVPSPGSSARSTVNLLPIDSYVRGVIAAEMPSSWSSEALKSQAVAARTYGVRSITSSRYYDICDTTACQVYGGQSRETSTTDAAVRATAGKILTYQGAPALTQFSSSSGGYTATGSQPYLSAVSDPYDAFSGNPNHDWTINVRASTIQKAFPSIGTLKQLKVTQRNGKGDLGGRVTTLSLVGSSKTVSITGDQARFAFGLKSNWFRF